MILSKESAATILKKSGWVPLSSTAECFVCDTSPLVIRVLDGEVILQEKEQDAIKMDPRRFPCTETGLQEALRCAEGAEITT